MNDTAIPDPPIHPLSAFVTIVIDGLWGVLEIGETISIAALPALLPTMVAAALTGLIAVSLVQHFVAHENWGPSIAKGFVMGITAGVPYAVVGTILGGVLLGWAGIQGVEIVTRKLLGRDKP